MFNKNKDIESFWTSSESGKLTSSGKFIKSNKEGNRLAGSNIGPKVPTKKKNISKEELESALDSKLKEKGHYSLFKKALHESQIGTNKNNPKEQLTTLINLYIYSLEELTITPEQKVILDTIKKDLMAVTNQIDNFQFEGMVRNDALKNCIAAYLVTLLDE